MMSKRTVTLLKCPNCGDYHQPTMVAGLNILPCQRSRDTGGFHLITERLREITVTLP
jgi:hypothetical protein